MEDLARANSLTWIIDATSSAITFNAQPTQNGSIPRYPYIIVKNNALVPCFVKVGTTSVLAAATYPTSGDGSTAIPQNGFTVLPGQSETYRKHPDEGFVSVVLESSTGKVHITPADNA